MWKWACLRTAFASFSPSPPGARLPITPNSFKTSPMSCPNTPIWARSKSAWRSGGGSDMKIILALVAVFLANPAISAIDVPKLYGPAASQILAAATNSDFAFNRLATLCDTFGPRFSGSTNLESAIDWALRELKSDGFANVHGEEAMVAHWVRGAESAELIEPRAHTLHMLGLGGSIGTPPEGIIAEVLVVKGFEDLR